MKITFMGAGSTIFARNVIGDCMCSETLRDSVFALYDIDAQRLEESRKEALRGAKFVINAIQEGLYDPCTIIDFEVPKKYGHRQTIGGTNPKKRTHLSSRYA